MLQPPPTDTLAPHLGAGTDLAATLRFDRLPPPVRDEATVLAARTEPLRTALDWPAVQSLAGPWVKAVRAAPAPFWALESLLREYPISSAEGLALMRLAEALLRVPDVETAVALTADQLGRADFAGTASGSPHPMMAGLSARAIALSKKMLPEGDGAGEPGLIRRLGAQAVVGATVRAIQLLGRQFVLGRDIDEAMGEAATQRKASPGTALRFSFDMLGEGARTERDAATYLAAYRRAVDALARSGTAASPRSADGISIKLSALYPRYEESQREAVLAVLVPRIWPLVDAAARGNLNLTVDAEESERLELSLDVFEALAARIAATHPRWVGFGLAIQAYQTRSLEVVEEVARLAGAYDLRFMVRLVKGAYWDSEIKRAQELGLDGYPVYTDKRHTDVAYLACADALVAHAAPHADGSDGRIYPQFATHNAGTVAAIVQLARARQAPFELQRLHGMGEALYREALASETSEGLALRVYAPVGLHRDLLAYLVRRLLENGANSSFVHQLADVSIDLDVLLACPYAPRVEEPRRIPLPVDLYGPGRRNARGLDLACLAQREPLERACASLTVPRLADADLADVDAALTRLRAAWPRWAAVEPALRAGALRRAADRLEAELPSWCALLVCEARKTLGDSVAEVREAIDFLRYYAVQAETQLLPVELPGPTGERNTLLMRGRGVFVCISPWNFPLAIFIGQVAAALVAGNAVAAKPAEQTPAIARRAVDLLHAAGVLPDALVLLPGPGETVGAALVSDPRIDGVCFTGSTAVARHIHRSLADRPGAILPLIAETGGVNAMLVDSSALPEQVVDAVVLSAFRSAGQRCSALRLLVVHEGVADSVIEMLRGALATLRVGAPSLYRTDVGPVIDAAAQAGIEREIARLRASATLIAQGPMPDVAAAGEDTLAFVRPIAFELPRIADVRDEIFGPVLQVVRWSGDALAVVDAVNALGFGLTFGVQTRIDGRALDLAARSRAGNVYVNRNMIGAVVGVQPFGGEGLSGTGPKAGGPHYLLRFCSEQVVSINTAAAGGNVDLLA